MMTMSGETALEPKDAGTALEGLRERHDRLQQIADHIGEVLWLSTVDRNHVLYVSRGYETIWGRTCDSLRQAPRSWIDAIHPDDRGRVLALLEAEPAQEFEVEYRVVRPDGSMRWVRDRGFPLREPSGRVYRVAGIAEDITERKRIEEQMRRSEQLLSEAQRVAHIGNFIWDVPTNLVTWSDELYRLFGVQPGDIHPASEAMEFVHSGDHDVMMAAIQHTFQTKEPYSFFYRIHRCDGEERILHSRGYLVSDAHGDPISVFGTTQDVTESRRAEATLQALATRIMHAQDDERRRVARMLHETTAQDLAGLKMLLGRLSRTSARLSAADRALLAESVQLADHSIGEVRTLAYLLHPPFLDEAGLLSAVRWYAQGFADRSGIHVELDLPDALERLPQDVETTLFRAIQEALINIHRHAESATAYIRLRIAGDRLALEIEDHGQGMAPEFIAQLMAGTGALGVGLAGIRERLKQIHGALEIESSREGTIVRASVPVPAPAS
jgi:PAS domain S-box-containing protein